MEQVSLLGVGLYPPYTQRCPLSPLGVRVRGIHPAGNTNLRSKGWSVSLVAIEHTWLQEAKSAIADIIRETPTETFYAAAFWLFYCDYHQILTPALAVNAESYVVTHDGDEPWDTRWVPAEWHWPVLDRACDALKPTYAELSATMDNATETEWKNLLAAHDQLIASVARRLTAEIHEGVREFADVNVPQRFLVAAIDDQRESEDYKALIHASVEPARLGEVAGLLW